MILNNAKDIKLGSLQVEKVYRGTEVIWEYEALPSGYQRCKYLQSNGNCVIDTLISPDNTYGFEIKVNLIYASASDSNIDGCRTSSSRLMINYYNGKFGYGFGSWITTDTPFNLNTDYIVKLNYLNDNKFCVDSNSYEISSTFNGNLPTFSLFAQNSNYSYNSAANHQKIYSFKMTKESEVIMSLIPCLDSDNTPCMYDTISKSTFYNQGTGTFDYELA